MNIPSIDLNEIERTIRQWYDWGWITRGQAEEMFHAIWPHREF